MILNIMSKLLKINHKITPLFKLIFKTFTLSKLYTKGRVAQTQRVFT